MDISKSYINVKSSTAIKGVLIILIALGHNMLFTYYVESIRGMDYLYCFHIQSFFLLPFLYGVSQVSKARITNYFMRLYWPYLLFTSILFICYYLCYMHGEVDWGILQMWITGDPMLIRKYCGIQIFWFLPAMFSLSILKDLYYYSRKELRLFLLVISIAFNILIFLSSIYTQFHDWSSALSKVTPFGIYLGGSYLCWGILCRWLIKRIDDYGFNRKWILGFFVTLSILFFINSIFLKKEIILISLRFIMPIIFLLLLWSYRKLFDATFWAEMGKYSYSIYLIHPFIGYILYAIAAFYNLPSTLLLALLALCFMVGSAYFSSILLYKIKYLRIFLLPRSFSELKSLICL